MTQIFFKKTKVDKFLHVEDVTLIKKSGDTLAIKNTLYDQLKWHKFCFQLAKIDKFLQVDDAI